MTRFGMIGKLIAKSGAREALIEILLESAETPMDGCESYIVSAAVDDADAVWVTEVWESEEHHTASLELASVHAAITRARPLIAGMEGFRVQPLGGAGLS
jgi:quinol monooxygenase YgiN